MSYLIDTNIISEVRKGARCNAKVAAWYTAVDDGDLYLSVLAIGEIRRGIERARRRDAAKADALDRWLTAISKAFAGRIIGLDIVIAEEWGRMTAGRDAPSIDALLAATAKVHALTLVTRNTADVADLGANVLNPFDWTP